MSENLTNKKKEPSSVPFNLKIILGGKQKKILLNN